MLINYSKAYKICFTIEANRTLIGTVLDSSLIWLDKIKKSIYQWKGITDALTAREAGIAETGEDSSLGHLPACGAQQLMI